MIREGGPFHARADEQLPAYAETARDRPRRHAEKLETHRGIVPQDDDGFLDGEDI